MIFDHIIKQRYEVSPRKYQRGCDTYNIHLSMQIEKEIGNGSQKINLKHKPTHAPPNTHA